jgi:hypothetical protein
MSNTLLTVLQATAKHDEYCSALAKTALFECGRVVTKVLGRGDSAARRGCVAAGLQDLIGELHGLQDGMCPTRGARTYLQDLKRMREEEVRQRRQGET